MAQGQQAQSNGLYITTPVTAPTQQEQMQDISRRDTEMLLHYFVDETEIIQSVPDNYVAWAVGSTRWLDQGSPYASKGHKYWGIANNVNTISIEMCSVNGKHTAKILENARKLGQALCELYNIDNAHVIRHFDVNGKLCPITFVTNETGWYNFKKDIGCDVQKGKAPTPYTPVKEKLVVDGLLGGKSVLRMQEWLGTSARDGWISGQKIGAYKYQMNLLAVDYNDGGSLFFADGIGLNTVKTALENRIITGSYVYRGSSVTTFTFTDSNISGKSYIICGTQDAGNPVARASINGTEVTVYLDNPVTVMRVNYICF